MSTFLLVVSFLLNALTIYAIIVLYTRQNRLADLDKKQERIIKDMEDLISSYLFEMKEENEKFLHRFENINGEAPENSATSKKTAAQAPPLVKNLPEKESESPIKMTGPSTSRLLAAKAYQTNRIPLEKPEAEEPFESFYSEETNKTVSKESLSGEKDREELIKVPPKEETLAEQIINLQKQGKSMEQIARQLKRGKTEIELILKFQQNKQ
ncbi:hypothetical protein [Neobacillus terrae]|uniref:hypothetical protein n=1 Tax=Neobacillus terrae TaxID=3034837 RepID=UPI0014073CD7|nr:hypothetical protein [Neobacillus terrae]NHM29821.1 hypothetical protein [Neobacillus terrae]